MSCVREIIQGRMWCGAHLSVTLKAGRTPKLAMVLVLPLYCVCACRPLPARLLTCGRSSWSAAQQTKRQLQTRRQQVAQQATQLQQ
jgi:hypothetical protein